MRNLVLFLATLVMLFTAGCVTQTPSNGKTQQKVSDGIVIKYLEVFPKDVHSDESFSIEMEIQNVGESDAENTEATLFNLGPFDCDENQVTQSLGKLNRPNPEYNLPGDIADVTWSVTAPSTDHVLKHVLKIKISYDYHTYAYITIPAVTQSRWRDLNRRGEKLYTTSYTSASPIKVDFRGPIPIILPDDGTTKTIKYMIVVENAGSGWVSNDTVHITAKYKVGKTESTCVEEDVKLIGGSKKMVTCSLTLSKSDLGDSENTVYLSVNASYTYNIEAEVPVTVHPPI